MAADGFGAQSQVAEHGGESSTPQLRVLLVGGDADRPAVLAGADVVGRVAAEEVVPAVDTLAPNVLVLEPALAGLAPRLASCPAGVVVASEADAAEPAPGRGLPLLEVALLLSLVRP